MKTIFNTCFMLLLSAQVFSQETISIDIQKALKKKEAISINRGITPIKEKQYPGIHLDERYEDGIVWLKDFEFTNGIIEFDTRGKDVKQHSFVGVAFHGNDTTTFECVYLRPFNFTETDDPKKSRMIQYVAKPTYTWQYLRGKFPGKYENSLEPAPAPDSWVHVKVVIKDSEITTFVNHNSEPCLIVESLGKKSGSVGFYVADTSGGDFANLKITKTQ